MRESIPLSALTVKQQASKFYTETEYNDINNIQINLCRKIQYHSTMQYHDILYHTIFYQNLLYTERNIVQCLDYLLLRGLGNVPEISWEVLKKKVSKVSGITTVFHIHMYQTWLIDLLWKSTLRKVLREHMAHLW